MLRITIQLIPRGDERKARTIGTMEIVNDCTGTLDVGNYIGTLHAEYTPTNGRHARVTNFRRRKLSAWSLVGAFLKVWGHTAHPLRDMSK